MISIIVNGQSKALEKECNVVDLLDIFSKKSVNCVVELNKKVVDRVLYAKTMVKEGDEVELVHFVGGG